MSREKIIANDDSKIFKILEEHHKRRDEFFNHIFDAMEKYEEYVKNTDGDIMD